MLLADHVVRQLTYETCATQEPPAVGDSAGPSQLTGSSGGNIQVCVQARYSLVYHTTEVQIQKQPGGRQTGDGSKSLKVSRAIPFASLWYLTPVVGKAKDQFIREKGCQEEEVEAK